jgi:FdhD protein
MPTAERPPLRRPVTDLQVTRVDGESVSTRRDRLATEEPLELRAAGPGQEAVSVAVTMRTPGADMELAAGFLYTEGLIADPGEIATIRYCDPGPDDTEQRYNVVTVHLRRRFDPGALQRNFYATSSCGVCGKATIDQLEVACRPLAPGPVLARSVVESLPDALRRGQRSFALTGGIHAAGLFAPDGALATVREDVGRHNAMDKLVGAELLAGRVPASDRIVLVSGRASFELVQKAAVAGIPVLCAVSAPSTLAVETARRLGMTLVGFLRGRRFNVYAHPERIALD